MSKRAMTYMETHGGIMPVSTSRLIKRFNVSPADLDLMTDLLGNGTWEEVNDHIRTNSGQGYYVGRTF